MARVSDTTKAIFAKLRRVYEAGAVDNETHVVALNIVEVADIIQERDRLREVLRRADHTLTVHGHIDQNTDLHQLIYASQN